MSEIRVENIIGETGLDAVKFTKGVNVTGVCTATSFTGAVAASQLTGALPAISGANLTGLSSGLSVADQWRISSGGTLTTDGTTQFTANWERGDTNSHGQIGSGMSESSGIFTFPSTGIYLITAIMNFKRNSGENRFAQLQIGVTTDNNTYATASSGYGSFAQAYSTNTAVAQFLFDVTNVSTHKVKFYAYTNRSSILFLGGSTEHQNSFTFLKLGDT